MMIVVGHTKHYNLRYKFTPDQVCQRFGLTFTISKAINDMWNWMKEERKKKRYKTEKYRGKETKREQNLSVSLFIKIK